MPTTSATIYLKWEADAAGRHVSRAAGGRLRVRVGDDPATLAELPDD